MKIQMEVQSTQNINTNTIETMVKNHLKQRGIKLNTIETLDIYYKPDEKSIYYVAVDKKGIIYGTNNNPIYIY